MNHHLRRIAIILDRSGSMAQIREATIGGFNEFIGRLKAGPFETGLKLVHFDDEYETVFDLRLQQVSQLTEATFVPGGTTARRIAQPEAQGRTIVTLGDPLNDTVTNGYENATQHFTQAEIARMVDHQQTVYRWQFIYLGANRNAVRVADSMGIGSSAALTYRASRSGVSRSFLASAVGISGLMCRGVDVSFSAMDRANAIAEEDDESSPEDEENHEIIEAGNLGRVICSCWPRN